MQQQQFIDIIKQPQHIQSVHLSELEVLVNEYPFFESAHLLLTKVLHQQNSIHYNKQLRKTAIVANNRGVLYELLHQNLSTNNKTNKIENTSSVVDENNIVLKQSNEQSTDDYVKPLLSPVTVTNNDIKVIYVNTIIDKNKSIPETEITAKKDIVKEEIVNEEIDIIKTIENETEVAEHQFNIDKLNNTIEQEISKGIIQSYVETDIIKTPELNKEPENEPSTFTDWLKTIKKEAPTFQIPQKAEKDEFPSKSSKIDKKPSFFSQNQQIIDKIIESDPGRIKLGNNKFFTPAADAKQSLLENEHLVTETLAKIYAIQGNISKAIRAYEILSLKFPQKSVYFASLIEKLKINK